MAHLRQVLEVLRCEKLYATMSICFFFIESVEIMGHVVSAQGVQVGPKKVTTIESWPLLKKMHDVQSFLGLGDTFKL